MARYSKTTTYGEHTAESQYTRKSEDLSNIRIWHKYDQITSFKVTARWGAWGFIESDAYAQIFLGDKSKGDMRPDYDGYSQCRPAEAEFISKGGLNSGGKWSSDSSGAWREYTFDNITGEQANNYMVQWARWTDSAAVSRKWRFGNRSITLTWNTPELKITVNSATGVKSTSGGQAEISKNISLSVTPLEGYLFDYWSDDSNNKSNPRTYTVLDSDIKQVGVTTKSFTPVMKPKTYTITFNANGGTLPSGLSTLSPTYNSQNYYIYSALKNTSRNGYTLKGFYDAPNGGNKIYDVNGNYVSGTYWDSNGYWKYDGNVTAYAQWTPITYNIAFNGNGSTSGSMSALSATFNSDVKLTTNNFSRKYDITYDYGYGGQKNTVSVNYSFNGWEDRGSIIASDGKTYSADVFDAPYYANTYSDLYNAFKYNKYNLINHYINNGKGEGRSPVSSNGTRGTYPNGATVNSLCSTQGSTDTLYAQWKSNSVVLPTLSRSGYTFNGWYTAASGGTKIGNAGASYTPTANITLYAQWTEHILTFKYYANNGETSSFITWNAKPSQSWPNNHYDYTKPEKPETYKTRIGYTGTGNYGTTKTNEFGAVGGKVFNQDYDFQSYEDLCNKYGKNITDQKNEIPLYAQWTPNNYTVQFDANSGIGSMSDLSMVYDIQKKLPKNTFTKTGYTFQGWSTNKNATSATYSDEQSIENLTSAVDGKVTLYAIWKANKYIIKYNGNGHTGGSTADSVHIYDIAKSLNNNGFKKEYTVTYLPMGGQCSIDNDLAAYIFKEWRTNADGSGDRFLNGQEVSNLTPQLDVFINLYAQWTETSIILPAVTRTGYTFDGWYTTDNKFIGMNGEPYIPKTNIVLEAHWIEYTYTIQFYGNGETSGNTESMLDIGYDEYIQLNKNGFIKTGYHFTTWNTSIDGSGESYTDGQYIKNLSDKDEGIVKLYVQWEPNKYKVQFNANGGEGTMNDQEHTYDSELALSKNQFKRIGYTFLGWAIHKDDIVPKFADEEIVENLVTGNTTILYAVWQVHTYTISFNGNGETNGEMTMILDAIYDVPLPLPKNEFQKIGHEFLGWSRNPEDTEIEIEDYGNALKLTSDDKGHVVLYAIWVQQFYDITWKRVNNGKDLVVSTPGGTIPQCPIFPFIEPDSEKHHIFVRWDRTILVADRPTEYTAIYEVGMHSYTIREVTEPVGDYWGYTTHICDEKTCNHSYIDSYRWRVIFRDENENILYNKKVPPETKIFPPSYIRKEEEYDDAEKNYYFDGWYEVNSGEKWYTNKVADTNLIYDATYEWKIQEYPVKWYDGDGNIIDSKILQYGEKPETDIIPTKANDGYNSYVFDGWSYEGVDSEGTVAGPVNCYAQFIATTLSYTVTWKNIDGIVLHQEVGFEYKEKSPEYPYSTPIHPKDEEDLAYDYEFMGWRSNVQNKFYPEDEDLPLITSDIIYTAVYKKIPTEYSIKVHILRLDESICLSYENLRYNETIYIDAHYYGSPRGYTFKQWNDGNETVKRIITVKGNAEYVAEYERNTYTVKWLDYNDKIIDIKELKYKTIPNHKEIENSYNFVKPYDDKYHYDFYGDWKVIRGDITKKDEILGNVVYKTIYQEELHTWTEPEFNFYIPIKEASAKRHCTHCEHFEEARVKLEKHILEGEEATCDKPGKITYIAPFYHSWNKLDSPRTLKVDIPALGHIWSAAKKLGEDGEFGYHCRVCNRCNTAEIEEHIWDDGRVTTYGACIYGGTIKHKCTAQGCTALYYEKVIPGNHGDFIETAAIPETCEEYGHKGYKQCTVCKLYFPIDVDANTVYGSYNINPFIIKPKGHNYNQEVVDVKANCIVNGWKRLICENNCGIDKVIEIKPRGHNFKEIETIYDSDKPCKYPSIKRYQCQNHLNEGEEIYYQNCAEEEIVNAPLVPHTPVVIKGIPPTCTEKGESNGKECAVCKDVLLEKHELPPLGHHMISKSLVPAENTLRREVMNTCVRKGCNYKIHLYYSD